MARELSVFLRAEEVGTLRQEDSGRLTFIYRREWLDHSGAVPLSLSLPLQDEPFDDGRARPYFAGLLPDERVRERLARYLGVSRHNDFALLAEIGGECAGAVSLHPPGTRPPPAGIGDLEPLEPARLAALLRDLPRRPLLAGGGLRLSLAGAQDKMALVRRREEFFLPRGDFPTTHILKPAIDQFADTVPNEAFCMRLAARMGLRAPAVEIVDAERIPVLVVERYDRIVGDGGSVDRLHQEDFCQALAIPPERRYQSEGGPSLAQCFGLLEACVRPAVDRLELLRRVVFNYLIGNADAHGKNFALLYETGGPRLAPAYDLLCTTVYSDHTDRMAMKIGGRDRFSEIHPGHWESFALAAGLSAPRARRELLAMADRLIAEARILADELGSDSRGSGTSIFDQIVRDIDSRIDWVRRSLQAS